MRVQPLRRAGGWIALLAIWLQLALSLGHLHPEDVWGALGHAAIPGQAITQLASPRHDAPIPADQDGQATEAACAICAAVHLTAHGAIPDAVGVAAPTLSSIGVIWVETALLLTQAEFLLARSRGPPLR